MPKSRSQSKNQQSFSLSPMNQENCWKRKCMLFLSPDIQIYVCTKCVVLRVCTSQNWVQTIQPIRTELLVTGQIRREKMKTLQDAELPQFTIKGFETNERKIKLATGTYQVQHASPLSHFKITKKTKRKVLWLTIYELSRISSKSLFN